MSSLIFYAHFLSNKVGKTGLSPTINIWMLNRADLSTIQVASNDAMTEIGHGLYRYAKANASTQNWDFVAVASTTDTSVDQQEVAALWTKADANLVAVDGQTTSGDTYFFHNMLQDYGADNALTAIVPALADYTAARAANLDRLDVTVSSRLAAADYVPPANADVAAIKAKTDNLPSDPASDTLVATRLAAADYVPPANADVAAIKAKTDNLPSDPASDTLVATRLAAADYVPPANADVAAIKAKTDNLPSDPASDTLVATRLAAADYVLPANADVAAIKAKTDNLPSDPASDTLVATRLAAAGYVPPANADVAAIKAKTDNLPSDPASDTLVATRLAAADYVPPANADVAAIKAKTDNLPSDPASNTQLMQTTSAVIAGLTGVTSVTLTNIIPIDPETRQLTLIASDDYVLARNAIRLDVDAAVYDMTGAIVTFIAHGVGVAKIEKVATIANVGDVEQAALVEIYSDDLQGLTGGLYPFVSDYSLVARFEDQNDETIIHRAPLTIKKLS